MNKLAIAYVTCDKYSHVWDEWHTAHTKFWNVDVPKYFCGEEKPCPFGDFENIPHESVPAKLWTAKLREQVEQIDSEYIFIWLDDMIQLKSIDSDFFKIFEWAYNDRVDSIRFMGRPSKSMYIHETDIVGYPVYRLTRDSQYLVSYSPNVFEKDFLLEILEVTESPWDSEVKGTDRIRRSKPDVCAVHIDGWYVNKFRQ